MGNKRRPSRAARRAETRYRSRSAAAGQEVGRGFLHGLGAALARVLVELGWGG
ncbi:hypothetical protein [Streptomyces sp. SBT349]|uniref:hypothetical protein n=1 Tax=Streptomyces sp. SBT349 TaxID=1580539 RepID=UPI000AD8C8F4|nr:hypothetical protein [Streptomyces sp. SBT349]